MGMAVHVAIESETPTQQQPKKATWQCLMCPTTRAVPEVRTLKSTGLLRNSLERSAGSPAIASSAWVALDQTALAPALLLSATCCPTVGL